jgi:hypothetical protein
MSVLRWIAGSFLVLIVLLVFQLFGPNPPIVVSTQTTFITEPLGADGLPDYEQYVLNLSRDGVTRDNNAVAILWQALFPAGVGSQFHAAVAAELGLKQIPSQEETLALPGSIAMEKRLVSFLKQNGDTNRNADSPADNTTEEAGASLDGDYEVRPLAEWHQSGASGAVAKLLERVTSQAWLSEQVPPLAEWANANKAPLDRLVEASRRSRYYAPYETLINKDRDMLISMRSPIVLKTRDAGRALSVRGMWHLGEGRPMDAWQNLLAIHRLSHLIAQRHTLMEQLVALELSGIASNGTVTFLDRAKLSADQARQVQRDLAAIPNFAVMARSLNGGERLKALDAFTRVGSGGGAEMFSDISGGDDFGNGVFDVVSVDWNVVLRETNRWYDRIVAAAKLADREARAAALATIEADMQRLVSATRTSRRMLAGVLSREHRSQIVSSTLELTRLAAALAVYRAKHSAYPESLDELVPGVIERMSVDVLSGKPFVYKRSADGYLLYGLGANGSDEGGSSEWYGALNGQQLDTLDEVDADALRSQIPMGADDICIRVPRPAFELPKITAPAGEQP